MIKPKLIVHTSRTPHSRLQAWYPLDEASTDKQNVEGGLCGIISNLGGDPARKNRNSLMRLAGTINHQDAKKRERGRVSEKTTLTITNAPQLPMEYVRKQYPTSVTETTNSASSIVRNDFGRVIDRRDQYATSMVWGAFCNAARLSPVMPSANELFANIAPVYFRNVKARDADSLEAEGRGQAFLIEKIRRVCTPEKWAQARREVGADAAEVHQGGFVSTQRKESPFKRNLVPPSQLNQWGKQEALVEDFIFYGEDTIIFAPKKSSKTTLSFALSGCIATGKDFLGRSVKQGPVLYNTGEATSSFPPLRDAFVAEFDADPDEYDLYQRYDNARTDLTNEDCIVEIGKAISKIEDETQSPLRALILDPLYTMLGNQGLRDESTPILNGLKRLRGDRNFALIVISHTTDGNSDRPYGDSGLSWHFAQSYTIKNLGDKRRQLVATDACRHEVDVKIPYELVDYGHVGMVRMLDSSIPYTTSSNRKPLTGRLKIAYETLRDETVLHGQKIPASLGIPYALHGVPCRHWREAFYDKLGDLKPDSKRKAFDRALTTLQITNHIGVGEEYAWIADSKAEDNSPTTVENLEALNTDMSGHPPIGVSECPVRVSQDGGTND